MDFSFEGLNIFKESRLFVRNIYCLSKRLPREESFGLSSQMRRAASSVTANFVEGHSRFSPKERMHFYEIAYGSLMETYSHLVTAMDVGYDITQYDIDCIKPKIGAIAAMLSGLRHACFDKMNSKK